MAGDPQNKQYSDPPFGLSPGIASTGAGGQPTALPGENAATLQTGVAVSVPGQSSQVAPDLATVTIGDTATPSFGPTRPMVTR